MFLLDTNIISEMVKKTPNAGVMNKLELHQDKLFTAAPVWHELNFGCQRLPASSRKKQLEIFLETVIRQTMGILPYDATVAALHAAERARLSATGKTPSFVDGQIAAIAMINNLTLVTRNLNDFKLFKKLSLENWFV
ncbi:MAG: type II toxin-antitoxin system VapC family toxin [Thermodesulfobacteriota bacterium]